MLYHVPNIDVFIDFTALSDFVHPSVLLGSRLTYIKKAWVLIALVGFPRLSTSFHPKLYNDTLHAYKHASVYIAFSWVNF